MPIMQRAPYLVLGVLMTLVLPAAAQDGADRQATTAAAADLADARWLPWMGCWQLWEEQVDPAEDGAEFPERTVVCITPAEDGSGARLTARSDSDVLIERTLVADGSRHALNEGDCNGWERRDWSDDGRRLFTRGEVRCGNDEPRRMSGISLLSNRSTWVDIQSVSVGDRGHIEIRRYNPARDAEASDDVRLPATPGAIREARQSIAGPLTVPSVREAAATADSPVVEALLTEQLRRMGVDASGGAVPSLLADVQRDRARTIAEMAEKSRFAFEEYDEFDERAAKKHLRPVALEPLEAVREKLRAIATWEPGLLHAAVIECAEGLSLNLGKVAQPLRVALTGTAASPAIELTLQMVGRDATLARIDRAIVYVRDRARQSQS